MNHLFTNDGPNKNTIEQMSKGFDRISDTIFISKFMDRIPHCWLNYPVDMSIVRNNVRRFFIDDSFDNPIYQDICYHPLMSCASVVFAALHFSLFTYPKEIYLVGCDTSSKHTHFYDSDVSSPLPNVDKIKITYARMRMHAQQYYPETEIISINPVGLKGLFRDVYTINSPTPDTLKSC